MTLDATRLSQSANSRLELHVEKRDRKRRGLSAAVDYPETLQEYLEPKKRPAIPHEPGRPKRSTTPASVRAAYSAFTQAYGKRYQSSRPANAASQMYDG